MLGNADYFELSSSTIPGPRTRDDMFGASDSGRRRLGELAFPKSYVTTGRRHAGNRAGGTDKMLCLAGINSEELPTPEEVDLCS
jgi:hypothetical protein